MKIKCTPILGHWMIFKSFIAAKLLLMQSGIKRTCTQTESEIFAFQKVHSADFIAKPAVLPGLMLSNRYGAANLCIKNSLRF
jgi:hypothetical protein